MMTRRIQQVEEQVGVQLLHRSTRVLTPTEAGELFYQQMREVVREYDAGVASVKTLGDKIAGTIKIGVPTSISRLWIAPTLHRLNKKYPDLEVRIVIGSPLLYLLSERFDLVIHCSTLPDSGFYYQSLSKWNKITCAAPKYIKKHGVPKHPNDLANFNCLDQFDNMYQTWGYKIKGKNENIAVAGNVQANSSMDLKALALSGMGLIYLPSFIIADEIKSGKLQEVLLDYKSDPYDMYAVFPHKKQHNKKIQVMLDYLDEVLPPSCL